MRYKNANGVGARGSAKGNAFFFNTCSCIGAFGTLSDNLAILPRCARLATLAAPKLVVIGADCLRASALRVLGVVAILARPSVVHVAPLRRCVFGTDALIAFVPEALTACFVFVVVRGAHPAKERYFRAAVVQRPYLFRVRAQKVFRNLYDLFVVVQLPVFF